jgi:hypothetical protein
MRRGGCIDIVPIVRGYDPKTGKLKYFWWPPPWELYVDMSF